ncbi:hypothetical protein BD293_0070 [Roseinatronobacter monicus]|uniref:Uncharacterized protein n=1 Tax=Roseinatronobacter monicus TaxID=393481 RepID=A0A543K8V7_9RHOB|nr:hypothetical protein BD293_0070 [Roseinatronobacter monicus]
MLERLLTPLLETLRPHFDLSKTRLEALAPDFDTSERDLSGRRRTALENSKG